MKMEPMINQLLRVLERESELYQSMLTVIDQESKGAIRSDLNALTKAGEEKENILVKLRSIEEQRIRLVRETADALGYPPREFTLTMMSQLVGEPLAGRLSQAGTDLSTVLNVVKDANHRNKQLFEHSLELLRGSFNLLGELTQSDMVYYRTGNIQRTYQTGKCVNGEI
ncbi:MAG: flagellar protein FlgN [Desulfobacterales bacterium]|jgi:flagellar biosynthesis/type III secretory pathway chaperone